MSNVVSVDFKNKKVIDSENEESDSINSLVKDLVKEIDTEFPLFNYYHSEEIDNKTKEILDWLNKIK